MWACCASILWKQEPHPPHCRNLLFIVSIQKDRLANIEQGNWRSESLAFQVLEGIGEDNYLQHDGSFLPRAGRWNVVAGGGECVEGGDPKIRRNERWRGAGNSGAALEGWLGGFETFA
jgi:hypothetical protein